MKNTLMTKVTDCLLTATVICALFAACQSEEVCEVQGSPCTRECAEGEIGICVTSSICSCVADGGDNEAGSEGGDEAGTSNAGSFGGSDGGAMGPSECDVPNLGDLVINEVMIDADGDENVNDDHEANYYAAVEVCDGN